MSDTGKIIAIVKAIGESGGGGGSSLPDAPSSDGEYFLKCAVEDSEAEYSWVTIPAANGVSF